MLRATWYLVTGIVAVFAAVGFTAQPPCNGKVFDITTRTYCTTSQHCSDFKVADCTSTKTGTYSVAAYYTACVDANPANPNAYCDPNGSIPAGTKCAEVYICEVSPTLGCIAGTFSNNVTYGPISPVAQSMSCAKMP